MPTSHNTLETCNAMPNREWLRAGLTNHTPRLQKLHAYRIASMIPSSRPYPLSCLQAIPHCACNKAVMVCPCKLGQHSGRQQHSFTPHSIGCLAQPTFHRCDLNGGLAGPGLQHDCALEGCAQMALCVQKRHSTNLVHTVLTNMTGINTELAVRLPESQQRGCLQKPKAPVRSCCLARLAQTLCRPMPDASRALALAKQTLQERRYLHGSSYPRTVHKLLYMKTFSNSQPARCCSAQG